MTSYDVVIVGSGHAGAQAAIALRQRNFDGSIAIVGDDMHPPYERPPLSKDYLSGDKSFERLLIRPSSFWAGQRIALHPGRRIVSIDTAHNVALTGTGEAFRFRHLVWATGGRARRLTCDGCDLRGVHTVRSRHDVDRIASELPGVETVVVIGGGYIGLEAAAVLTKLGKRVILVEALDRVLARVAGEQLSRFIEHEHRAHGVDVRLQTATASIEGENGMVVGVRLADGDMVRCDMVIAGIGIVPEVEPLLAAGADGGDGIDVDEQCRTSVPGIFAIGDCARHRNIFANGSLVRLESVQNANDMAAIAADAITGLETSYHALPWFWSNQYDLRLQTVGLLQGHDEVIVRGDIASRSFSILYRRAGRVIALDCVNATRDYVQGRLLITTAAQIDGCRLADTAVALKDLVAGLAPEAADH